MKFTLSAVAAAAALLAACGQPASQDEGAPEMSRTAAEQAERNDKMMERREQGSFNVGDLTNAEDPAGPDDGSISDEEKRQFFADAKAAGATRAEAQEMWAAEMDVAERGGEPITAEEWGALPESSSVDFDN